MIPMICAVSHERIVGRISTFGVRAQRFDCLVYPVGNWGLGGLGGISEEVGMAPEGCEGVMEATNRWRALRGEEPLIVTI